MDENGSSNDEEDAIEEYRSSLEDLTFNSKPLINVLTMLAEENISKGDAVVNVIKERIEKVNPLMKMASLYLLDSILKNVGKDYKTHIAQHILDIFKHVFLQGDEKIKVSLFKLRHTWGQFFSPKLLFDLDTKIHELDPNWPVPTQPPPSPTIHVNPKFLKQSQSHSENRSSATPNQEDILQEEEKRIKEQLKKLQEARQEIERKRLQEKEKNSDVIRKQHEERERLLAEQKRKISALRAETLNSTTHVKHSTTTTTTSNQSTATEPPKLADPRLVKKGSQADLAKPVTEAPSSKSSEGQIADQKTGNTESSSTDLATQGPRHNSTDKLTRSGKGEEKPVEAGKAGQGSERKERVAEHKENGQRAGHVAPVCDKAPSNNTAVQRPGDPPLTDRRNDMDHQIVESVCGTTDKPRDPRRERIVDNKGGEVELARTEDRRMVGGSVSSRDPRLAHQNRMVGNSGPVSAQDMWRDREREAPARPVDRRFEFENREQRPRDHRMEVDVDDHGHWRGHGGQWRGGDMPHRGRLVGRGRGLRERGQGKENTGQFGPFGPPDQDRDGPPFKRMRVRDGPGRADDLELIERGSQFAAPGEEEMYGDPRADRGRYPRRRLSAYERRVTKMRAREERKRMVPKETELPPELRMDNHKDLMHEIEMRLKTGELTEHEHNGLVAQLELLYRIQRNRREVSEIEMKAKLLKDHRERSQLQEHARSIERRSGFERSLGVGDEEPSRGAPPDHQLDRRPMEDFPRDMNRIPEPPPPWKHPRLLEERGREGPFLHPSDSGPRGGAPQNDWNRPWQRPDRHFFPGDRHYLEDPPLPRGEQEFPGVTRGGEFVPRDRWPANRGNFADHPLPDLSADMDRWSRSLEEPLPPDLLHRRDGLMPGRPPSPPSRMDWEMSAPPSDNLKGSQQELEADRNRMLIDTGLLRDMFLDRVDKSHLEWSGSREPYPRLPLNPRPEQENLTHPVEYGHGSVPQERTALPSSQDNELHPSKISSLADSIVHEQVEENTESVELPTSNLLRELLTGSHPTSQPAEATTTTTSAPVSSAPSFMGVTELFKKLVNSGIITLHKEAETVRTETPPPELPTEEEAIPEIKISLDSLRQRHTSVINRLYKGVQCASCGLRFPEDAKDAYAEHLDWHFRQNKRQKDQAKASSRVWYSPVEVWTSSEAFIELSEEAIPQSIFEDDTFKVEKDDQEEYTCAVEQQVEDDDICDVCCELFEQFWDEDLEEWRYRGAVRVSGRTYHFSCYKDSGAVAVESGEEEEEEMAVDEKEDSKDSIPNSSALLFGEAMGNIVVKNEPISMDTEQKAVLLPPRPASLQDSTEEASPLEGQLSDVKLEPSEESCPESGSEINKTRETGNDDVVIGDKIVDVVKSETLKDENMKAQEITS